MTCQEIYERIATEPLNEWPAADRDAIQLHASQCPRCGPALASAENMALALGQLHQPEPGPDLSAMIMARLAQLSAPDSRAIAARPVRRSRAPEGMSWACTLAGVAIVTAERTNAMISGAWTWISAVSPLGGAEFNLLLTSRNSVFWLLSGLLLFLMGLLARRDSTTGV
jgi:hypothetical protein